MSSSPFILFLSARALVSLSVTMLSVAIGWHIYQITGNPFDLALVGLVQVAPALMFFIVIGMIVDHLPRKTVLLVCVIIEALLLASIASAMHADQVDTSLVFTLLFAHGAVMALFKPASDSILPSLLPPERLQRGIALSMTVLNVALTSGPFIAGFLLAWIDRQLYWVMVALLLLAASGFSFLPRLVHLKPTGRGMDQVLGGLRFIWKSPQVLGSISLDLFIVLLGSVVALLPVYATDILKVGPDALGFMRGMPALGAAVVGVTMARLPELRASGLTLFLALLIFATSIFVFAFSTALWLSLLALFIYGASDMISVNVRSTLVLLATPESLRGRVTAVNSLFITASNQLGDFRAGSVAAFLSPVATVAVGGLCALGVAVGGYYLFPSIRKLDRLSDAKASDKVVA